MTSLNIAQSSRSRRTRHLPPQSEFGPYVDAGKAEKTLRLQVKGATCGGCLSKIEKAVRGLQGVTFARLNLSNGEMQVRWDGSLNADTIAASITNLGFSVAPISADAESNTSSNEERSLLISMGIAGFAAANIMLLSISVWAGHGEMGEATRKALHALSGVIAAPVLLFSGRHFFLSAINILRHGHANMDVPISLALVLAFGVSVTETIRGGEHAYFDAAVMLLFFLLIGRFLEARLKRQAYSAANSLAAMRNKAVTVVGPDNTTTSMAANDVRAGDIVLLAPGERAMVDMRIVTGTSDVDDSFLTGESLPKLYVPGMILHAGAINLTNALQGEALGAADNSLLASIAEMLEAGEQRRTTYRKLADCAVSFYIPFVHTTAALAGLIWLMLGAAVSEALMISVTTLIITCPCALALAAPVAQIVAASRLFKRGIFLRSGDALERFAEVDHVAFDKTGTLTLGRPTLLDSAVADRKGNLPRAEHSSALKDAATLARASHHPLSLALAEAAGPGAVLEDVQERPGKGLIGTAGGEIWNLGSADWVGLKAQSFHAGPTLFFKRGNRPIILFEFADEPLASAGTALQKLTTQGISAEIISGDRTEAVSALAGTLSVKKWTAECTPESKVAHLEQLRRDGHKTLMVGDGLNDTGALSLAHASLTPGTAMDLSQSASDAVYCGDLTDIPEVIHVARRTRSIMRQNFSLAAGYNLIAVPIAVAGLVTPLIAAIAMSLSSILVTLNALRLQAAR